jgi:orotate phosphoribosyltransferase
MAREIAKKFSGTKIDFVIGPALGGITLAYEAARALKVRGLFTERQEGAMALRRGFMIRPGENALVVEDVITTGGSTREVINVVNNLGGKVIGVASVIDRSHEPVDFGVPFTALAKIKVEAYKEGECPLCMAKVPIAKPGSKK